MAKCEVKMPEDLIDQLSALGNRTDSIVPKVLQAGAEVVEDQVRTNLKAAIGHTKTESRSTGQLLQSLGTSPAKVDRDGNHNIKIGFSENRNDGKNNAMIANVLEYGKHGQSARPFIAPAKRQTQKSCVDAMRQAYEREASI